MTARLGREWGRLSHFAIISRGEYGLPLHDWLQSLSAESYMDSDTASKLVREPAHDQSNDKASNFATVIYAGSPSICK